MNFYFSKIVLILLILFSLYSGRSLSQDSDIDYEIDFNSDYQRVDYKDSARVLIKNQTFHLTGDESFSPRIFTAIGGFNRSFLYETHYRIDKNISFYNCKFLKNDSLSSIDFPYPTYLDRLFITNSHFQSSGNFDSILSIRKYYDIDSMIYLAHNVIEDMPTFKNIKGNIMLESNIIKSYNITVERSFGELVFYENTSPGGKLGVNLKNNKGLKISNNNSGTLPSEYNVGYNIEAIDQKHLKYQKNFSLYSSNDILDLIDLVNVRKSKHLYNFAGSFFKQYHAYYFKSDSSSSSYVRFYDAKFQNGTELNFFNVDTLEFNNCRIDSNLNLSFNTRKRLLHLILKDTNLQNLKFEFQENMVLAFEEGLNPDGKNGRYQSLLEKFSNEGKSNSFMLVDIQYKQYKYSQRFLGTFINKIDELWWNYGYDKGRIIMITIAALFVFFFINYIISNQLLSFYPILEYDPKNYKYGLNRIINKSVLIFILTIYIFFSLRIELDKFKSHQTRLIVYFFFQYFFGLICLLFIFGAIIKF